MLESDPKLLDTLVRVEKKLDVIIRHFSMIEPEPRRSVPQIEAVVSNKIIALQKRKKAVNLPGHGRPEKIRE